MSDTPQHTPAPLLAAEGTAVTSRKAWTRHISGDTFRGEYAIEVIEGFAGGSVSGEVASTTGEQRAKAIAAALRHEIAYEPMREALRRVRQQLELRRAHSQACELILRAEENKIRATLAQAEKE